MAKIPLGKSVIIMLLLIAYVLVGIITLSLVNNNTITKLDIPPELFNSRLEEVSTKTINERISIAIDFMEKRLVRDDGHVYLYYSTNENYPDAKQTNSEAMSYYLQWTVEEEMKREFDNAIEYVERSMIHPNYGFMQWRIEEDLTIITDGENMASDADLRTIYALKKAYEKWGDEKYLRILNRLSLGLEKYAITPTGHLAPYVAISNNNIIRTNESWLSYADFRAFDILVEERGEPWFYVRNNMKKAIIKSQIVTGFYESVLLGNGNYANYLDGDAYSINNLWIMVRNSESKDEELQESARRLLKFYEKRLEVDTELYSRYTSNGYALSPRADSPWVYALVARAAIHLDEKAIANDMIKKLLDEQETNPNSIFYGAFPEGQEDTRRAGQFTLQEAIITLQDYREYTSRNQ